MKPLALMVLTVAAGCASPSASYFGVQGIAVEHGGRDYRVFLRLDGDATQAQVIRMGRAGGRDHRPNLADMATAAETASGCVALPGTATGDSGVLNLRLRCPD